MLFYHAGQLQPLQQQQLQQPPPQLLLLPQLPLPPQQQRKLHVFFYPNLFNHFLGCHLILFYHAGQQPPPPQQQLQRLRPQLLLLPLLPLQPPRQRNLHVFFSPKVFN
jgi:hypothetical protein